MSKRSSSGKVLPVRKTRGTDTARATDATRAFAKVVAAFAGNAKITVPEPSKRGFGSNALKVDGQIFAMLVRGTFVVKLAGTQVAELTSKGRGVPFEPKPGRLMKEWLVVAPPTKDWLALARDAHEFVSGRD